MKTTLRPEAIQPEVLSDPFPHFVIPDFLSETGAERLMDWLEGNTNWKLRSIKDFYDTYDADLRSPDLPDEVDAFRAEGFLNDLRDLMGSSFNTRLGPRVDIALQKMIPGQRIALHTDYGPLGQSHRLLIQLNRKWNAENGGFLMLFDEEFPTEVSPNHIYYLPLSRTAIGFEISPRSFHAVSNVKAGIRYTLTYSFYLDGP